MPKFIIGILALVGYPLLAQSVAPPVTVSSIIITPSQVNVSSSAATVSVNLISTSAGFNWGVVSFVSPSGGQQLYGILLPIGNGVFQATVNVAQDAGAGVWHIASITLMNGTNNHASLSFAQVTALGLPTTLTVSAQPSATTHLPAGKVGVYRSAGAFGLWVYDTNGNGVFDASDKITGFGLAGDYPVVGDWNGTGVQSIGVFRGGVWYLDLNNNGQWDGVAGGDGIYFFGLPGDIPVVGDWTGSGTTNFGVFRCSPGQVCAWILDANGSKAYEPSDPTYYYGLYGDIPVVNNWNGTGTQDQIGVYRPMPNGLALWIVDSNGSGAWEPSDAGYQFGWSTDIPIVGNWNNGTRKRIGVYRGGLWVLDTNGNNAYDATDGTIFFGVPSDKPVVGNWLQ